MGGRFFFAVVRERSKSEKKMLFGVSRLLFSLSLLSLSFSLVRGSLSGGISIDRERRKTYTSCAVKQGSLRRQREGVKAAREKKRR